MVTLQQNILSLQVQFNSFCQQIETKSKSTDLLVVFSPDYCETFSRIVTKALATIEAAQNEGSSKCVEIERVTGCIQVLAGGIKNAKGPSSMGQLLLQANTIKKSIHEIYLAIFNPNAAAPQVAQVNANNDHDMAAGDWIVEKACKEAKSRYPKSVQFLCVCVVEVQRGQIGDELQEALTMCLPSIWSIEALLKLALLSLALKKLPLAELDCFPLTEKNQQSLKMLTDALDAHASIIISQLLLQSDSAPVEWTPYITELNRFVKESTISRNHALGLMNLLQKKLTISSFLEEIETLVGQKSFIDVIRHAAGLSQQSQRASAYCYLADRATSLEELRPLLNYMQRLDNDDMQVDTIQHYVTVLLDKFPESYREARTAIGSISYWAVSNLLYERIIRYTLTRDPQFCLNTLRTNWRNAQVIEQFVEVHGRRDFALTSQAIDLIQDRTLRKDLLLKLKDCLGWVPRTEAHAVARQIVSLCSILKNNKLLLSQLAKGIGAHNFALGLQIAILSPVSPLCNTTLKHFAALLVKHKQEISPTAIIALVNRMELNAERDEVICFGVERLLKIDPEKSVELFLTYQTRFFMRHLFDLVKEAMKKADALNVFSQLQKMDQCFIGRDELLIHLSELTKSASPLVSFNALWCISNQALRDQCLVNFYNAFPWNDENRIINFVQAIEGEGRKNLFLFEGIVRLWASNILMALELYSWMTNCPEREKIFAEIYKLVDGIELSPDIIEALEKLDNPHTPQERLAKRACENYEEDKVAIKALLPTIQPTSLRDNTYFTLVQNLVLKEKETALEFSQAIDDKNLKEKAMVFMAESLARADWNEAVSFVDAIEDPLLSFEFYILLQDTPTAREHKFQIIYKDVELS